jgi:hypothetical protein
MTLLSFYDWSLHFVANLPSDQGKDGEGVILFVDGHSSRFTLQGLLHLYSNNVYVFILPSKTSVWAQPNDSGPNRRLAICVSSAAVKWRAANAGSRMSTSMFNAIFVDTWQDYLLKEDLDLRQVGTNCCTTAWKRTGLEPFNKLCVGWDTAIESLGGMERGEDEASDPPPEVPAVHNARSEYEVSTYPHTELTEEEKKCILSSVTHHITCHKEAAAHILRRVLARWRDKNSVGHPKEEAFSECEMTALKVCSFVDTTSEEIEFSSLSQSEIETSHKLEQLELTLQSTSIPFKNADRSGNAIRVPDGWTLVYEDGWIERNLETADIKEFDFTFPAEKLSAEDSNRVRHRQYREKRREREQRAKEASAKAQVMRKNEIKKVLSSINKRIREGGNELTSEEWDEYEQLIARPFCVTIDGIACSVTRYDSCAVNSLVKDSLKEVLKRPVEPMPGVVPAAKKYKNLSKTIPLRRGATVTYLIRHLQMNSEMRDGMNRDTEKKKLQKLLDVANKQVEEIRQIETIKNWLENWRGLNNTQMAVVCKALDLKVERAVGQGAPLFSDRIRAIETAIAMGELTASKLSRAATTLSMRVHALENELACVGTLGPNTDAQGPPTAESVGEDNEGAISEQEETGTLLFDV